ncbi:Gfo/Idh/MocA family protein [Nocardia sp. SC052]|uniref:Gfo/Idh/MocA family protein n=1 Tax=Nocardia sichangensis TaxID=3385975 RepID=UPI0039A124B3
MSPLDTVVVGCGHAATSFHLPVIADLVGTGMASGSITVVDPADIDVAGLRGNPVLRRELAAASDPDRTVVHVCTPPSAHVETVLAAHRMGYRKFVVEKPMATTVPDAECLIRLCRDSDCELLVVANWTASLLTDRIRQELGRRGDMGLRAIAVTQFKPRLERTFVNRAHSSALDVEMPHMVALALSLIDGPLVTVGAATSDLVVGQARHRGMGSATIALRSEDGVPVWLHSDLTAPWRERSIRIDWADGHRLIGFYPCGSDDRYAQLLLGSVDGPMAAPLLFYDDTVRRFLHNAYSYFAGVGPKVGCDVHFGAAVVDIIDTARRLERPMAVPVDYTRGNRRLQ